MLPPKAASKDFPIKPESQPAITAGCPAPRGSETNRHHRRMRSAEFLQHGIVFKLKAAVSELLGLCCRKAAFMIDARLLPFFFQHRFRVLHPPIVKDSPVRWGNPFLRSALEILLRRLEMEPYGIAAGLHLTVGPNDPHGFVIEPGIRRPIVSD